VARALIVGCGCRGRELGARLVEAGWAVRGTTRNPDRGDDIAAAGIDVVVAHPGRIGTVLDHIGDVTLLYWLMGSAVGDAADVEALHGARLERLMEELVDTPVRGLVYEAAGTSPAEFLQSGTSIVGSAAERWRIPVEIVREHPGDAEAWAEAMLAAAERLTGSG
jgi:nucleoside-diphosphate-sugar epimerase